MLHLPFFLNEKIYFPPVELALKEPQGLLAAGGDLSVERLLHAYSMGIFPWYNEGEPILWWSPNPRMVLFTDELKISRSLAKRIRNSGIEVRYNTNFDELLFKCATCHNDGIWLTEDMRKAYKRLYEAGFVTSVESYLDGKLVGGLYGVVLEKCFFGESMFSTVKDASKIALANLVEKLKIQGFEFIDCQIKSDHLESLGAREISRKEFTNLLNRNLAS